MNFVLPIKIMEGIDAINMNKYYFEAAEFLLLDCWYLENLYIIIDIGCALEQSVRFVLNKFYLTQSSNKS